MLTSPAQVQHHAKRIISLVPSQTELLHHLGLHEKVVGVTKFCVHPAGWKKSKTIVGGTKNIDVEKIKLLQPDLIIANKEENVKEQVEEIAKDFPVYVTDVNTLDDALKMIADIGLLTNTMEIARTLCNNIQQSFTNIKPINKINTAYFIWRNPFMTVGGDTFINDMLKNCGFVNVFASQKRYPVVELETLKECNVKLLLLSSEPYPFKQKHIDELHQQLPGVKIILVDGEMFSWYGSRLMHAPSYFNQLIHSLNHTI